MPSGVEFLSLVDSGKTEFAENAHEAQFRDQDNSAKTKSYL